MNKNLNIVKEGFNNQLKDPPKKKKNYKFNIGQVYQIEGKNNIYHEFDVLPLSLTDIIDNPLIINKLQKSFSKWTKEERSNFAYSFTHYYDKYFCGILYQKDKPNTKQYKGTQYKRLYRKVRNTSNFRQEVSLIDAYKQLSDQRQVTLGPNLSSRQIFVVEVDRSFTWDEYDKIINICSYNPIPLPSCIIINRRYNSQNKTQNHYHIMWILDDYFFSPFWNDSISKDLYNLIADTLTSVFEGDIKFQKLFAKNPYCEDELETLWIRDKDNPYISFEGFLKDMKNFITDYDIKSYKENKPVLKECVNDCEEINNLYNLTEEEIKCIDWKDIYSRNVTATHATGKRLLQLKNRGILITFNLVKEIFVKYETFVANIMGIYKIESNKKINASCKGILRFINRIYCSNKSSKYDDKDRESSSITKSYLSYGKRVMIEVSTLSGKSQNKTATENGYSKATVSRLKGIPINLAIKKVKEGYKYFKNKELNSEENSQRKRKAAANKLILRFIIKLYKAIINIFNYNKDLSLISNLCEGVVKSIDLVYQRLYNRYIDISPPLTRLDNRLDLYIREEI